MIESIYRKDLDYDDKYTLKDDENNPGKIDKIEEYLWKRNIFNNVNLLEKIEFIDFEEAVIGEQIFEYDNLNRITKNILNHNDYDEIVETSYEYLEDQSTGNKTVIVTEKIGEEFNQKEITVTKSNNHIIIHELHDSYGMVFRNENIYDGEKILKTIHYNIENEAESETEYETDNDCKILKETTREGKKILINLNTYDQNNNLVEIKSFKNDVEISTDRSEFDKNGNIIKWEKFIDGKIYLENNYNYDENGNMTERTSMDMRKLNFTRTEKLFDDQNNILEELSLDDSGNQEANIYLRYERK